MVKISLRKHLMNLEHSNMGAMETHTFNMQLRIGCFFFLGKNSHLVIA